MKKESEKKDFASDTEIIEASNVRKAKQKALAFLRRGQKANIPKKYFRINASQFSNLLDLTYIKDNKKQYKDLFGKDYSAKNTKEFASYIYDNADKLLGFSYILIDGGNAEARRRAGNALLFRLILCDKWGMYRECTDLSHVFQSFNMDLDGLYRNDLVSQLKKYGVLFVSEFYAKLMSIHYETGSFFDELFTSRSNSGKTTIVSFSEPIQEKNTIKTIEHGVTFADLSRQIEPSNDVLRIKVVPHE